MGLNKPKYVRVKLKDLEKIQYALSQETERTGPECHNETVKALELTEKIIQWAEVNNAKDLLRNMPTPTEMAEILCSVQPMGKPQSDAIKTLAKDP